MGCENGVSEKKAGGPVSRSRTARKVRPGRWGDRKSNPLKKQASSRDTGLMNGPTQIDDI